MMHSNSNDHGDLFSLFIRLVNHINSDKQLVYTRSDFQDIEPGTSRRQVSRALKKMVATERIYKIGHGFYVLPTQDIYGKKKIKTGRLLRIFTEILDRMGVEYEIPTLTKHGRILDGSLIFVSRHKSQRNISYQEIRLKLMTKSAWERDYGIVHLEKS